MRNVLAVIGALCCGGTFILIVLGILYDMQERADRKSRERQQASEESVQHIRRFTAAMHVIDLEAYRARKANAPSGCQVPSEASLPVSTGGRTDTLASAEVMSNG